MKRIGIFVRMTVLDNDIGPVTAQVTDESGVLGLRRARDEPDTFSR